MSKENFKKYGFIFCYVFVLVSIYIVLIVGAYFFTRWFDSVKNNDNSNIVLHDDNYYMSYHFDNEGNIISDNLLDNSLVLFSSSLNNTFMNETVSLVAGQYTLSYSGASFSGGQWQVLNGSTPFLTVDVSNTSMTFTIYETINFKFYANVNMSGANFMLNMGSSSLPYEPFGTWYKNDTTFNYFSYYSDAQLVYQNNVVYDTSILSSGVYRGLSYIDTSINMTPELDNIDYLKINFSSNINVSSNYVFSVVTFGYDYTFQFYNLNTLVFSLNSSQLLSNDNYRAFYTFNENFSFNNLVINNDGNDFLEDSPLLNLVASSGLQYTIGFNDGRKSLDGLIKDYQDDISTLRTDYNTLNSTYNTLLEQYNLLASDEYSFENLFWSLSSVPFGILLSAFNVQVMGVNLRGIISGLFTAALLIWLFKKFFK